MEIPERKRKILSVIVERYVETGEPIGSKAVSGELEISFSPATIRKEMSDLFFLGYLNQPHISAGRVPSKLGYRLYIDELMNQKPLPQEEKNLIRGALYKNSYDFDALISAAANLLSEITNFVSILTLPSQENSFVRKIRVIKISKKSAILVLIVSSGLVKNKFFSTNFELTSEVIEIFEDFLNQKFKSLKLSNLINNFSEGSTGTDLESMILPTINALIDCVKETCKPKIIVSGVKNLLTAGISNESIIDIFKFLEDKKAVLELVSCGKGILIGGETGYLELENASLITTEYKITGKTGFAAILGSIRMNYSDILEKLTYVAKSLEDILKVNLDKEVQY